MHTCRLAFFFLYRDISGQALKYFGLVRGMSIMQIVVVYDVDQHHPLDNFLHCHCQPCIAATGSSIKDTLHKVNICVVNHSNCFILPWKKNVRSVCDSSITVAHVKNKLTQWKGVLSEEVSGKFRLTPLKFLSVYFKTIVALL